MLHLLQFPFFTLGWIKTHHPGPPAATVWRSPRTPACRSRESTRQDSVTGQPAGSPDPSQECSGAARQSSNYPAAGATATTENPDCTTAASITAAAALNSASDSLLCAAGSDNGARTKPRTKTFSTTQGRAAAAGETSTGSPLLSPSATTHCWVWGPWSHALELKCRLLFLLLWRLGLIIWRDLRATVRFGIRGDLSNTCLQAVSFTIFFLILLWSRSDCQYSFIWKIKKLS